MFIDTSAYLTFCTVSEYQKSAYECVQTARYKSKESFAVVGKPIVERARLLVEAYRRDANQPRPIMAIAGCSGVGKTHFSQQFAALLSQQGIYAVVVHFDDFIELETFEGALSIHPRFNFFKAQSFLQKISRGEERIEKPIWDSGGPKPAKISELFDLRGVELVIIEGEFTLCDHTTFDLLRYSSLRLLLDADDKDIVQWTWKRNRYIEIPSFPEFEIEKMNSLKKYREDIEPIRKYADFILMQDSQHGYYYFK